MSKKFLFYLGSFIIILFFVFRNLILNLSTNLLDWRDYPFIIWVMSQNVTHIQNLDLIHFFETNAFYPHKLTALFTDILLPQSVMYLPIFSLSKNPILSLNLIFIMTFILNFISSYLFWKQLFKKEIVAFLGSLFLIFSPFFHMELSHYQMLSYWPFLFAFYFLFKSKAENKKNLIIVGLLLTVQFLTSVYLSVYLIFSILIFYLTDFLYKKSKHIFFKVFVIFFFFLLTSGVFIKGYTDMKNTYQIKRDIKEYITYSANLSDYIFTTPINSLIHKSQVMQIWNKADKNWGEHSSFPGFLVFTLSILALFKITKDKQSPAIILELSQEKTFFLILIIVGFLFSLGPRVTFNGTYAHIPLPYSAVLKFIPFAEAARVPSRWSFLFFLGLIYFSLITLNKLGYKPFHRVTLFLIFAIFIFEYIPINIQSVKDSYINNDYQLLKNICSREKKVLLELPVTHLNAYPNILEGLRYVTVMELSSTYHGCLIVNGYSGYDLPDNFILSDILERYIKNQQTGAFVTELRKRQIDYVKFNQYYFIQELKSPVYDFLNAISTESGVERISQDLFYIKALIEK